MVSDFDIDDVTALVATQEMELLVHKLKSYIELIADESLSALLDSMHAYNTWQMLAAGLTKYPQTMPMPGGKTFADYPEVIADVLRDGLPAFYNWVTSDRGESAGAIREQAILRNLYHFFEFAVRMGAKIPPETMGILDKEFAELDYSGNTVWLYRIFNGLQTSFAEVYVVEMYFKKRLQD